MTLKNAIQNLIDDCKIVISVSGTPPAASTNILQNPLPQHPTDPSSSRGPAVNSIEEGDHLDRFFSPIQSIHAYTYGPANPPPILQGANPFPPSVSEPVVLEGALPYDVPVVQGASYGPSCWEPVVLEGAQSYIEPAYEPVILQGATPIQEQSNPRGKNYTH